MRQVAFSTTKVCKRHDTIVTKFNKKQQSFLFLAPNDNRRLHFLKNPPTFLSFFNYLERQNRKIKIFRLNV